uniref:phenylalanine--tRNA ligase n=1 Tax=Dicranema revolutum TaxID=239144 RepID=A0A4D6WUK6_9FLOR|nr:Phenylalanine-tRNA ligase beta subunit [Dicranema revolutum]
MKFSWKWLNELIDLPNIPLKEITKQLILTGFEVEDQEKLNHTTLNVSITTNRSDTASIIGFARELSSIFNIKALKTSFIKNKYNPLNKNLKQKKISNLFPLVSTSLLDIEFEIINNIKIRPSPQWLQNHLKACNIMPQNSFHDISEYINIKWGQDIEIFDLNKITNTSIDIHSIQIKTINKNKIYKPIFQACYTSHGVSIEGLTYNNEIVSIFGINSNSSFHCDTNTSSIIILAHICKPDYIKTIINTLEQKTSKSQKHLKGISRQNFIEAYQEIINLISQLTYKTINLTYKYKWHKFLIKKNRIKVNKSIIDNILGPTTTNHQYLGINSIKEILTRLHFQPQYHADIFTVTIPEYRNKDLKRPIDIVEEIGRIYGFNNFIDQLPQGNKLQHSSKINQLIAKIRTILRNLGFYEIINYPLENVDKSRSSVILYNPILEDQAQLRNYLIYNILNTIQYNNKNNNSTLEYFEIGRVFHKKTLSNKKHIYIEDIHIGGAIGNNEYLQTTWLQKGQTLSWFQAKGIIQHLFQQLHAKIIWTPVGNLKHSLKPPMWLNLCHPYKSAILKNKNTQEIIGIFSELSFKYAKETNKNQATYFFEFNILNLMKTIQPKKHLSYIQYKYSHYPSVTRDISLILTKKMQAEEVQNFLFNNTNKLVESVKILKEYYIRNKIDQDKERSISFRITYRSKNRTLNNIDISKIDQDITNLLKKLKVINITNI